MTRKARLIAYYLPQYHPIPENDEWWGKGFTEWTNVAKAKPLFRGHYQPRLPADLGFYDLRVPEVREAQAEMARNYGIEGFCYYHYWFGNGRMLLERPINEVIASGKPDFPFSFCWANETWSGIWFGETDNVLIEQIYPGREDYEKHFEYLLKAFSDDRYMKIDGKPIFQILTPRNLPNCIETTDILRELAHKAGLKGLHLIAGYRVSEGWNPLENGFDAVVAPKISYALRSRSKIKHTINQLLNKERLAKSKSLHKALKKYYRVYEYRDIIENIKYTESYPYDFYPCTVSNFDNTARSGYRSMMFNNSTPELFKKHLTQAVEYVQRYDYEHQLVFIKSWNEWAEGNYLEPDVKFGHTYLEVVRECIY